MAARPTPPWLRITGKVRKGSRTALWARADTLVDQMGFEIRLFTVVQITNLNVFLVAIILLAQLSKPFLQRKVEGLRFGYDRLNQF